MPAARPARMSNAHHCQLSASASLSIFQIRSFTPGLAGGAYVLWEWRSHAASHGGVREGYCWMREASLRGRVSL
jgi:hypothetical protein